MSSGIKHYLPFLQWLSAYRKAWLKNDLFAGITVGVMLIPQGMAYALIAGLPPEYGLYASVVPLLIYAILGTSRQLAVGPVALVALLVASTVSPHADTPEQHIALSILLALMVGVLQLLFGLLRLGFLVNLLSHPVLSGFVSAAAIVIGLSQMHHLLGVESISGGVHEMIIGLAAQWSAVSGWTLGLGVGAIALILLIKRYLPLVPGPVVAVIAGIAVVSLGGLHQQGVQIVGEIPAGLPAFAIPTLQWDMVTALVPMAVAISLVAYMESIAVAKAIQQKAGDYTIDANQELMALGAANLAGSLFQSFPVAGGFSRTAVNYDAGAHTGLASMVSAFIVAITLLMLTALFFHLPNAVLAAIIMVAVYGLIEYRTFRRLWALGHYDRYMFLATFAGTLFIGIEEGILLGVVFSVIMLLYRSARPHHAVLGRVSGTTHYRNIRRYTTEATQEDPELIFRFDAPLHFANAAYFRDQVYEQLEKHPDVQIVILDFNGVNDMDTTGLDVLFELMEQLHEKRVEVRLVQVKGPVRDIIQREREQRCKPSIPFYATLDEASTAGQ